MASIWDQLDIFQSGYTFSNKISSSWGKAFTLVYFGLFMYLTVSGMLKVVTRTDKTILLENRLNSKFTTDSSYYKNLHVIFNVGVYRNDNVLVTNPEEILKEFLTIKITNINSQCLKYKIDSLYNYKVYSNNNLVTYFTSYDINSLNDFFKITVDKQLLKTDAELNEFLNTYKIRVHLDYYFLQTTNTYLTKLEDYETLLKDNNPVYFQYDLLDYLTTTKGSKAIRLDNQSILAKQNYILSFNAYNLSIDPNILFSDSYLFNSFVLENIITNDYDNSLSSFEFKLSPIMKTYNFGFKKISNSIAEIAGLMNSVQFMFYVIITFVSVIKRNQYFSTNIFSKNVIVKNIKEIVDLYNNKDLKLKSIYEPRLMKKIVEQNCSSNNQVSLYDRNIQIISYLGMNRKAEQIKIIQSSAANLETKGNQVNKLVEKVYYMDDNMNLQPRKNPTLKGDKISNILNFLERSRNNKIINFPILSFFKQNICTCCSRSMNSKVSRKIFFNFMSRNIEKMDMIQIQNKLDLIDILKYLLLDRNQLTLLSLVEKEQMVIDYETKEVSFQQKYSQDFSQDETINTLIQMNENMKRDTLSVIDKKLLSILDTELVSILEV